MQNCVCLILVLASLNLNNFANAVSCREGTRVVRNGDETRNTLRITECSGPLLTCQNFDIVIASSDETG